MLALALLAYLAMTPALAAPACPPAPAPVASPRGKVQLPLVGFVVPGRQRAPILLPDSAVMSDGHGSFVHIIDEHDRVARRDVVTGEAGDRGVVILRGLEGCERVVHAAGPFLNPGDMVLPERVPATPAARDEIP